MDGGRPRQARAKLSGRSLVCESGQSSSPIKLELVLSNNRKTINNACASVALLNIVNNVPNIELGENLRAFREFTASFSPALRGDAIGNFEFVKEIHNSFAR